MPIIKLTLKGTIKSTLPNADLEKLTIELRDQNQKIKQVIASSETNKQGVFRFELNPFTIKRQFQGKPPEAFLIIRKKNRILLSTLDEYVLELTRDITDIKINLSKKVSEDLVPEKKELPKLKIDNLLKISGVKANAITGIKTKLKQAGLLELKSILSKSDKLTTSKTGLDKATLGRFKAVVKFAAGSDSESLSGKLISKGFHSFADVGSISHAALVARVGTLNKTEKNSLNILYRKAKNIRDSAVNNAAFTSRLKSKDGLWQMEKNKYKDIKQSDNCLCKGCDNVFSPYSYLINLLDMIHYHWQLSSGDLEKILLQQINDIDCESSLEPFCQIELAIEVLEKDSRIQLPLNDSGFKNAVEKVWSRLILGDDSSRSLSQLRSLEQNGTVRLKKAVKILLTSNKGLTTIRKGIAQLKSPSKIKDLASVSPRYEQGGEQFEKALDKAYSEILLLYRDALIGNLRKTVEQLQEDLFIDLKAGTCKKTNRISFLILSLQSFILLARTGKLSKFNRPDINSMLRNKIRDLDAIPVEEESWKWLKDYQSWASAMYVFLYPENVLIPFFGENFHIAFTDSRDSILGSVKVSQDAIKTGYLNMISNIIGGNLDELANYKYDFFYNPEIGFLIDSIFFPSDKTITDNSDTALAFIKKINVNSSLATWINVVDLYMGYLGFDELINQQIFLEKQLFFPLMAAWTLNRSEEYAAAHDWYRQLYDPTKSANNRYVFDFNQYFDEALIQDDDWNEGLLDPNEIALHREGVMLRHVIIMMVKNLLDWADHEFALATASSLDRARQLYELAQEILNSPDLADNCYQSIRSLTIEIVTNYGLNPSTVTGTIIGIIEDLNLIDDPAIIDQAIEDIRNKLPDDGNIDPSPIEKVVHNAITKYQSGLKTIKLSQQITNRNAELLKYEDETLKLSATQNNSSGVSPVFFSSFQGVAAINPGYNEPTEIPYTNPIAFCIPPNPWLIALDTYIKISLLKFQLCLDITGEPLPQVVINDESVAEFFDTVNAEVERQPLLDLPATWFNQPPRYRYSYLIEKARQYTELAQRMGSALINAYEKYDNEKLAILKAKHAIELASSSVDLRNLGLKDAVTGLELANLQSDRAKTQFDFWQERIDSGMLSDKEQLGIFLMTGSAWLNVAAGVVNGIGAIAAFFTAGTAGTVGGAVVGSVEPGGGNVAGAVVGGAGGFSLGAAVAAAIPGTAAALGSFAGALSTFGTINLTMAGFERRFEDWNLQKELSDFDLRISEIQITSATNRTDLASQELSISKLQNTQAKEVLSFLENKFSNDHLYEWMIQVLSQNYKTLMQISSNVARQAQQALEFERQEHLSIISGDYWSISSVSAFSTNLSEEQKNSGLLGAERLLTDLTRLDSYKLGTEKRRLQLSKSIAMAQMLPGELATLKTSGKVTFNTLMHWFDRDFPGHYLRLIKSVKVSMLAFTPPVDGIHATLSNSGESTVVIKDGTDFTSIRAFRNFGESIAMDSPFNETGLFVFNYEDPMLLPFEGLGVETQWVLELPKASNRFNFDTLIDVMFTIEYTALYDEVYAHTVKQQFGDFEINDIPVNIRLQYPDEWYHFKNDGVTVDNTRQLNIDLPQQFLPAQYEAEETVSTTHITVMLIGNFEGLSAGIKKQLLESIYIDHDYKDNNATKNLKLTSQPTPQTGETKFLTKLVQPENGLYAMFSTRENNNQSSPVDQGIDPTGDWKIGIKDISMPNNTTLGELIDDVLVVVTTKGKVNWN